MGQQRLAQQFSATQLRTIRRMCQQFALLQRCERRLAVQTQPTTTLAELHMRLIQLGGVKIAYRRKMTDSPAYQRNHEELDLALAQGITYVQGAAGGGVTMTGHINGLRCSRRVVPGVWNEVGTLVLPARTILLATGAQPNIAYEYEHRGTFAKAGHHYASHVLTEQGPKAQVMDNCKDPHLAVLTSYDVAERRVSFIGDSHPAFHGSVVKAMASGMRGAKVVNRILGDMAGQPGAAPDLAARKVTNYDFLESIQAMFTAQIMDRERLSADLVWLRVRAPYVVSQYQVGQFLRLQNFMGTAPQVGICLCI